MLLKVELEDIWLDEQNINEMIERIIRQELEALIRKMITEQIATEKRKIHSFIRESVIKNWHIIADNILKENTSESPKNLDAGKES